MQKTILLSVVLGLIVTIYSGCSDALDVSFDANYDENIVVVVPEESRSVTFKETITIDPATDENVQKYGDKIKEVNINSVTLEIVSVSKDDVNLNSGKFSIYPTGNEGSPLNANWILDSTPIVAGETIVLGNENGQWSNVSSILKQLLVFDAVVEGETDQGDVTITFKLRIETQVVANPL